VEALRRLTAMKKLLIVVLVLLVAVGGVGYWRGWFSVGEGKVKTDPDKFKKDKAALIEKAKNAGSKIAGLFKKKDSMAADEKAKREKELAEMDALQKQHEQLDAKLKAAAEAGEDKLSSEMEALTKALEEVDKKIDDLTSKLEKAKDK
jgi:hypothetical protein